MGYQQACSHPPTCEKHWPVNFSLIGGENAHQQHKNKRCKHNVDQSSDKVDACSSNVYVNQSCSEKSENTRELSAIPAILSMGN